MGVRDAIRAAWDRRTPPQGMPRGPYEAAQAMEAGPTYPGCPKGFHVNHAYKDHMGITEGPLRL